MRKIYKPSIEYIQDPSLNLLDARRNLILKALKDFPNETLSKISTRLEISVRQLHREMKDMQIMRIYRNKIYEIL